MSTSTAAVPDNSSTGQDLQSVVAALRDVVDAVAKNTAELRAAQRNGGLGSTTTTTTKDDRRGSAEQLRTVLNYQVVSQMLGRATGADLTVQVERFRDDSGFDSLRILNVPADAVAVAVQAANDPAPEVLTFGNNRRGSSNPHRVVLLVRTAEKDIVRLELLDRDNVPIRLGPRLPRLPADDGQVVDIART